MLPKVNLKLVTTEREKEEVKAFGLTFDHELEERHFKYPVFAVRNDEGNLVGFFQLKTVPIAFTGWHPDIKPLEMVEACRQLYAWNNMNYQLEGRDSGYVGVNLNHETFTPSIMKKLGFDRVGVELYQGDK